MKKTLNSSSSKSEAPAHKRVRNRVKGVILILAKVLVGDIFDLPSVAGNAVQTMLVLVTWTVICVTGSALGETQGAAHEGACPDWDPTR